LCQSRSSVRLYSFDYKKIYFEFPFVLVRCKDCGFIYNRNRLKTEQLNKLYNTDYYVIDPKGLEKRLWFPAVEDYLNKIRPLEEKISGRNFLDIGCGMGFLLKICRDNGWTVKGVDVSATAVEYAGKNLGIKVEPGRMEDVDFGENKFNLICALDLLEHLEQPLKFIELCYELLEKNGILVMETPNAGSIYKKITGKFWVGFNPYHIQIFSPGTLGKLVRQSKFEIFDFYTTYNDIFAKRNLWRWFSSQAYLKNVFSKLWQLKRRAMKDEIYSDISRLDTSYGNLEKNFNLKNMTEGRDSLIAKKLWGDQLVIFLIKK
jgi:2-polyprenyl-3-methyl-5-hydroxy-6-metoxy-1,4-benzoquinol methylase